MEQKLSNCLIHCSGRQFYAALNGFLATGLLIGAKTDEQIPLLIQMFGFISFGVVYLLTIQYVIFKIHDLHTSLKKLKRYAEDLKDIDDGKMTRNLVRDIEDLEPISGFGLFTVDRTTLTSIVSVMITYLIVLIQFKQTSVST